MRSISVVFVVASFVFVGCGPSQKERCVDQTGSNFGSFLADEWSSYCSEFQTYVETPADYDLLSLTAFFGAHPERVQELREGRSRYEYQSCFSSNSKQLELRHLNSCLDYNDSQQVRISNAWNVAAEPWLEELKLTIGSTKPKLNDMERESKRLQAKAEQALDYQRKMDAAAVADHADALESLVKEVDKVARRLNAYDILVSEGEGEVAVSDAIATTIAPTVEELAGDVKSQRERVKKLKKIERYLTIASTSAGRECPAGKRLAKEGNIVDKLMKTQLKGIEAGKLRIAKRIQKTKTEEGDRSEQIEGYVCGLRNENNQYRGSAPLCAIYQFKVERKKEAGQRRWSKWGIASFEEGEIKDGVDCGLIE